LRRVHGRLLRFLLLAGQRRPGAAILVDALQVALGEPLLDAFAERQVVAAHDPVLAPQVPGLRLALGRHQVFRGNLKAVTVMATEVSTISEPSAWMNRFDSNGPIHADVAVAIVPVT